MWYCYWKRLNIRIDINYKLRFFGYFYITNRFFLCEYRCFDFILCFGLGGREVGECGFF